MSDDWLKKELPEILGIVVTMIGVYFVFLIYFNAIGFGLVGVTTSGAITDVSHSENGVTVTLDQNSSVDQIGVIKNGTVQKYVPVNGNTEKIYLRNQAGKHTLVAYSNDTTVGSATFTIKLSSDPVYGFPDALSE